MELNVAQKIIQEHLISGELIAGTEIALKIDQTLTQDATGTLAYLEFESMGISRVKTDLSVSYIDHNTLQSGFENADDHLFLQTFASKYGITLSKAGNGICHQVHLERFGIPGSTLLGSDSHTPTGGGIGMIAIGAGGIDVACAMAGTPFNLVMPKIVQVELKGSLRPWVTAKDIILELLKRLSVKGGVGKIFEYSGDGVKTLSVPERATITNMGAELGATTSVFPSDEITREFLKAQKRDKSWKKIIADDDAKYDEKVVIDLGKVVPLMACPHMPDNVREVSEFEGTKVDQVIVGSCTNSSYKDLMTIASMLKGNKVSPGVSFAVAPGSKQVLEMITANGALEDIIQSGARILEVACGPCIGMGQAPSTDAVSLRTFNRNFEGRSGTPGAKIYLVSPETAVASALHGVITDPRKSGKQVSVKMPSHFMINESLVIAPSDTPEKVKVIKGPNISSIPQSFPLSKDFRGEVLLKVGDNITTDHICPAGAKILPYRSNVPKLSEFVYSSVDADFHRRALNAKERDILGVIVGGKNYGQGSSREHAALCPMYLGVKAVIAVSFARIHRANLVNFGILPLIFDGEDGYLNVDQCDKLLVEDLSKDIMAGKTIDVRVIDKEISIKVKTDLTDREKEIIAAGGILGLAKKKTIKS